MKTVVNVCWINVGLPYICSFVVPLVVKNSLLYFLGVCCLY